mmetsp:Transcript_18639/g.37380  ORF Transcript_18639/g.37380 Transcript_18639/m.37380 type:complete len:95 (+) Transcript_18639:770-1054(+)
MSKRRRRKPTGLNAEQGKASEKVVMSTVYSVHPPNLRVIITELDGAANLISINSNHLVNELVAYTECFAANRFYSSTVSKEPNSGKGNNFTLSD